MVTGEEERRQGSRKGRESDGEREGGIKYRPESDPQLGKGIRERGTVRRNSERKRASAGIPTSRGKGRNSRAGSQRLAREIKPRFYHCFQALTQSKLEECEMEVSPVGLVANLVLV